MLLPRGAKFAARRGLLELVVDDLFHLVGAGLGDAELHRVEVDAPHGLLHGHLLHLPHGKVVGNRVLRLQKLHLLRHDFLHGLHELWGLLNKLAGDFRVRRGLNRPILRARREQQVHEPGHHHVHLVRGHPIVDLRPLELLQPLHHLGGVLPPVLHEVFKPPLLNKLAGRLGGRELALELQGQRIEPGGHSGAGLALQLFRVFPLHRGVKFVLSLKRYLGHCLSSSNVSDTPRSILSRLRTTMRWSKAGTGMPRRCMCAMTEIVSVMIR